MGDQRKVTYGDLTFAKRINSFSSYVRPTYLIVASPKPTKKLNANLVGYHWIRCSELNHSFFNEFGTIQSILEQCEQENWNVVICAPSRAIAYALSRILDITDPNNQDKTLREILSTVPKQFGELKRDFYLELALYQGWTDDDEECTKIVDDCTDKRGLFVFDRFLRLDFTRLGEIEYILDWRESAEV